jgi:hypothetical protein
MNQNTVEAMAALGWVLADPAMPGIYIKNKTTEEQLHSGPLPDPSSLLAEFEKKLALSRNGADHAS